MRTAARWLLLAPLALAACGPAEPVPAPAAREGSVREFWSVFGEARDLYAAGRHAEAAPGFARALAMKPDHPASLYASAHVAFLLRRHEQALGFLERLKSVDPQETKAWLLAATVLSDPQPGAIYDPKRAAREAGAARALNAEDSAPALVGGRIALLAGDVAVARERLATAARANPRNAEALALLGIIALREGRNDEAASLFGRAEAAAEGAPPPAGFTGEGDTAKARAGYVHRWLLVARWGRTLAGAPSSRPAGEAATLPGARRSGRALAAFDADADGDGDVVSGSLEGPLLLWRREGAGFAAPVVLASDPVSALAAADVDRDGDPDIFAAGGNGFSPSAPILLLGDGRGGFQRSRTVGEARRIEAVAVADVDGDGAPDLVDAGYAREAGSIRVWKAAPSGWAPVPVGNVPEELAPASLAAIAPRGRPADVVVACVGRPPLLLRGGAAPAIDGAAFSGIPEARAALAADLDGDGLEEVVFGILPPLEDSMQWLLERGTQLQTMRAFKRGPGGFEELAGRIPAFGAGVAWISGGDVDGDGRLDLVAGCGGPEPWRVEPWWLFRNGREGIEVRPGPGIRPFLPSGAAVASAPPGGRPILVVGGGGLVPGHSEAAAIVP